MTSRIYRIRGDKRNGYNVAFPSKRLHGLNDDEIKNMRVIGRVKRNGVVEYTEVKRNMEG
jgi:hypothetical protein